MKCCQKPRQLFSKSRVRREQVPGFFGLPFTETSLCILSKLRKNDRTKSTSISRPSGRTPVPRRNIIDEDLIASMRNTLITFRSSIKAGKHSESPRLLPICIAVAEA